MSDSQVMSPRQREKALLGQMQDPKLVSVLIKVLPKQLSADRFVRQAVTMVRRAPDLLNCDPVSVLGGMIQAAELGLELSGVLGHCWLIPRDNHRSGRKEATFQMGYRGYRELVMRSGKVLSLQPRIVCAGDEYEVSYGTRPYIEHRPGKVQGEPVAFYCAAFMAGGGLPDFVDMSRDRVQAWRMQFAPPRKTDRSPWATHPEAMALKTVTGILCRRLPLSVEVEAALNIEPAGQEEPVNYLPRTEQILEDFAGLVPAVGDPAEGLDCGAGQENGAVVAELPAPAQ